MSKDPLGNEDNPIPGSRSARVHMVAGLIVLVLLLAGFIWFIATHMERGEGGGGFFGYAPTVSGTAGDESTSVRRSSDRL